MERVYFPGVRLVMTNSPWEFALADRSPGVTVMRAPGSTSPPASVTVPTMVPVPPWAITNPGQRSTASIGRKQKIFAELRIRYSSKFEKLDAGLGGGVKSRDFTGIAKGQ